MRRWRSSRAGLTLLAIAFAASTIVYTSLWMTAFLREPIAEVELGFDPHYANGALVVFSVYKNSPAEKMGIRPGDRILAVDGETVTGQQFLTRDWLRHKPGDSVRLTIRRPGRAAPLILTGKLRRPQNQGLTYYLDRQVRFWYPLPFVIVGLTVLFLRLDDRNVWLLALLFTGIVATLGFPIPTGAVPAWWPFTQAYAAILVALAGPLFYWLFAVFPERSPIDRRAPWLKWLLAAVGLTTGLAGMSDGRLRLPPPFPQLLGEEVSEQLALGLLLMALLLGLLSLVSNYFQAQDRGARRKIRVMFWGAVVSIGPNLIDLFLRNFAGFQRPLWLGTFLLALMLLFPLTFAYAVVKHRVLEIPVLLKRSARYLLVQRGFTFVLSMASIAITLLFAASFARVAQPLLESAQPSGIALGAAFGTLLLWSGTQVHKRVSGRIDRAFFRSAYDARMILEELADRSRAATSRQELASLLEGQLSQALHPSFLTVQIPPGETPGRSPAERHAPECEVPMLGREGRPLGMLRLGPRLSEEPYSGEDKRLLASVASQAATALENIRLAEEIAGRMEIERRTAREMEIASDVQRRLLPQSVPKLKTLDCAARCIQTRAVGGDYYDFLALGEGRVGLVVADVSGKGVHAALLVANLQAQLRSQSGIAPLDPVRLLERVNAAMYRTTAAQHFATLFFGAYNDATGELAYVNCGHNPPVWLRQDGTVARLEATATVIGAFSKWQAALGHAQLAPGDLLTVFSDGVTEAARGDEDFGEARLIAELQARRQQPVDEIASGILAAVQEFSAGEQFDDLTLLIARAVEGSLPA